MAGGLVISLAADANDTLIHAGTVLAIPGETPLFNQTIRVREGLIVNIESGFISDTNSTIIDGRNKTFLPGLIDAHVHLSIASFSEHQKNLVRFEDADWAFLAAHHGQITLMAGFTAVQDVGGPKEIFALRDAINAGLISGPHIRAAGPAISVTGGHGDSHSFRHDLLSSFPNQHICDGVGQCRRAVRHAVKSGADVIKITATGGVMSVTNAGTGQQMFDNELQAIVETAATMGRKVTAHAHDKAGIEAALNAGVDSIEHGSYADTATASLFKENQAVLVSTLLPGKIVPRTPGLPPPVKQKALRVGKVVDGMIRTAYAQGVEIAFGTDSGVTPHGQNAEEFLYLVEAGMTPMEAIQSATVTASRHINMSDQIGTLEPGKYADIIAVDDDPLADISALIDVSFVMKGGIVHKNAP